MSGQAETSVQVEDGYSRIAHPILEAMAAAGFAASQYAVLMVLIRETYGWGRKEAALSLADLERRTSLHRNTVHRAVTSLIAEGVMLVIRQASFGAPAVYQLQKDPRKWGKYSVPPESLGGDRHRPAGQSPLTVSPQEGGVTLEGDTTDGDRGVTLGGDSHTGQPIVMQSVTAPERKVKETTTTARTPECDDRTTVQAEMERAALLAAERIPEVQRRAFLASLANLISGDDYTAWRDHTGEQVEWTERPRLLRLAINLFLTGQYRDVRLPLTAVVIPQQYDPFPARRSTELGSRAPMANGAAALPCSVSDIEALLGHAGPSVLMAPYRPTLFKRLEAEHAELWARAGPYFRELDFTAIDEIKTKRNSYGLERAITEQLRRIAGRLDAA